MLTDTGRKILGWVCGVCGFILAVAVITGYLKPAGAEQKECEVEKYAACVPVCVEKFEADGREHARDGLSKNPVFDYALWMKNRCHQTCDVMAWSNCYLPEADRLQWKN